MRPAIRTALAAGLLLAPGTAFAQTPSKLPPLIIDVRAASVSLAQDPQTALDLSVETGALRKRAFALSTGVHVYPFRRHGFAIGVGEELLLGNSTKPDVIDTNGLTGDLTRRVRSVATIVSANFGGHDGWSYLSGGIGPMRVDTSTSATVHTPAPFRMTPNFGGGARWFTTQHMAVGFDVRAYYAPARSATPATAGALKSRMLVMAIGFTFR